MKRWPHVRPTLTAGKVFLVCVLFVLDNPIFSAIPVSSQVISKDTTWKSDTIKVSSDIIINEKSTLTINPGVVVEFQGAYKITVYGAVNATGLATDSIKFNTKTALQGTGWQGIQLISSKKTSVFNYCVFSYGNSEQGGALYAQSVLSLEISHSSFCHNKARKGGAIYLDSTPATISDNCIFGNTSAIEGGGIYLTLCNGIVISNNSMYRNTAAGFGGAIYSEGSRAVLKYNKIFNNYCADANKGTSGGGGIASISGFDQILNNLIYNNETILNGGGIIYMSANGQFINNTVCNNKASQGGGISIVDSNVDIQNSIVWNNVSASGSIFKSHNLYIASAKPSRFRNCLIKSGTDYIADTEKSSTFTNNVNSDPLFLQPFAAIGNSPDAFKASWLIGPNSPAIDAGNQPAEFTDYDVAGNPRVTNAKVDIGGYEYQLAQEYKGEITSDVYWYGKIRVTGDISISRNARLTVYPSTEITFDGAYSISVYGEIMAKGEPQKPIVFSKDVTIKNRYPNTPDMGWKGLRIFPNELGTTSQLDFCVFEYCNNITSSEPEYGGAIHCLKASKLEVKNTIIRYCAASKGGAVYASGAASVSFTNALFYGNYATAGGIFNAENTTLIVRNCTSYSNEAELGGAIYCLNSSPVIENSILWKNRAKKGAQIYLSDERSDPDITYSDVENGFKGIEGPGSGNSFTGKFLNNIDKNPLFNNPDKDNQFSLKSQSPCVNAGNPNTTPNNVGQIDLMGNNRFKQSIIDMGAYEHQEVVRVKSIEDVSLIANSDVYTIDLSKFFTFTGVANVLRFSFSESTDTNTVSAKINAAALRIIPKLNATGTDTLIILVESSCGATTSDTFLVKVNYLSLALTSPYNNYRFKFNEDQVLTWAAIPASVIDVKGYCLKIVEVNDGQTSEQALLANMAWLFDTITSVNNSAASSVIRRKFPVYGKMAWQVSAIGLNRNVVGVSTPRLLYGAPMLKTFYAGSNVIEVDTTTVHDTLSVSGVGRIVTPRKGTILFNFNNLALIVKDNFYYLNAGEIVLPYCDTLTLNPVYSANGIATLVTDSFYINRFGYTVQGKGIWDLPIAQTQILTPASRVAFNNFQLSGELEVYPNEFYLSDLPDMRMVVTNQSMLSIAANNRYSCSLNGNIVHTITDKGQFTDDSVAFNFTGISSIDYFSGGASNQKKLGINPLVNITPVHFIADFSGSQSPAAYTTAWKGIWVDWFKLSFNANTPDYPLALTNSDGIIFNAGKCKYNISANGIELNADTVFQLAIPSKLDGFNANIRAVSFIRPWNSVSTETITGSTVIPFVDDLLGKNYVVNFEVMHYAPELNPQLTDFSFSHFNEKSIDRMQINSGHRSYEGEIDQLAKTIRFSIPDSVNIKSVSTYFITKGVKVSIAETNIVRDVTHCDFSAPTFVRVYAGNGTYSDYVVTVLRMITDIREVGADASIFPNPAQDYIKVTGGNIEGSLVSIFNMRGTLVFTQYLKAGDTVVPLSTLLPGVYIMHLKHKDFVKIFRIIKE
jgi:hypothetical protein